MSRGAIQLFRRDAGLELGHALAVDPCVLARLADRLPGPHEQRLRLELGEHHTAPEALPADIAIEFSHVVMRYPLAYHGVTTRALHHANMTSELESVLFRHWNPQLPYQDARPFGCTLNYNTGYFRPVGIFLSCF